MYFLILQVPSTHSRGQKRSHISLPELPGSDQTLGGFLWQTNHGRRELLRKKKTQSLATWNNLHSIWGVVLNYDDLFLKVPGPSIISSLKPRVPPWLNCESTFNLDVHVKTLFQHIFKSSWWQVDFPHPPLLQPYCCLDSIEISCDHQISPVLWEHSSLALYLLALWWVGRWISWRILIPGGKVSHWTGNLFRSWMNKRMNMLGSFQQPVD